LLLFISLFVLQEVRPLCKAKAYKEVAVAGMIMMLALAYGIDYIMGTQLLPNPNLLLTLFKPLHNHLRNSFR
jgi:hypothetical protein